MASTTPEAEEVSRVNKLLQIEDLAWSRQLEKAVSTLILSLPYFWLDFDGANFVSLVLFPPLFPTRVSEIPL